MEAPSNVKKKRTPTPVCAKNYDIILGGSIFITLLAMPSSAPFKSTTSYGIQGAPQFRKFEVFSLIIG